jgi:predicted nucleic acid-binding protein
MIRAFLDASVIFAAVYSKTGAARELFRQAIHDQVRLVVNQDVLDEAQRNLTKKAAQEVGQLRVLMAMIDPEIAPDPSAKLVAQVSQYVVEKDVPVVAGALATQVDYLVTFDRKHLIEPAEVAEKSGLKIVLPEVVVEAVRREQAGEE